MIARFEAGACSLAHAAILEHSRSFALAAQLLPQAVRDPAVVLYAYCRRADDAIDFAAGYNVNAIVLRIPITFLAGSSGADVFDVWATISLPGGTATQ